jgi:hypothetical protein
MPKDSIVVYAAWDAKFVFLETGEAWYSPNGENFYPLSLGPETQNGEYSMRSVYDRYHDFSFNVEIADSRVMRIMEAGMQTSFFRTDDEIAHDLLKVPQPTPEGVMPYLLGHTSSGTTVYLCGPSCDGRWMGQQWQETLELFVGKEILKRVNISRVEQDPYCASLTVEASEGIRLWVSSPYRVGRRHAPPYVWLEKRRLPVTTVRASDYAVTRSGDVVIVVG